MVFTRHEGDSKLICKVTNAVRQMYWSKKVQYLALRCCDVEVVEVKGILELLKYKYVKMVLGTVLE